MYIENDAYKRIEQCVDIIEEEINSTEIPNLFDYITDNEYEKILEVGEILLNLAHSMCLSQDEYIDEVEDDYYDYNNLAFESYDVKDHIEYKGYDISYIPDYVEGYTVQYCGDDIVFDTIDEAKAFIDDLK